jgi:CHAT domain-containing protein
VHEQSWIRRGSCDAGLAAIEKSVELLGLSRALLYAGASSAMLSYWPLDDFSAYLFIERCYSVLQGMIRQRAGNKAGAIRDAQTYVHGLTVRDIVARCDAGAEASAARLDLQGQVDFLDEAARWTADAGDVEAALRRCRELLHALLSSPSIFRDRIEATRDRLDELEYRLLLDRKPARYDDRPFSDERYWAGFFLHGDWRL